MRAREVGKGESHSVDGHPYRVYNIITQGLLSNPR